MHVINIEPCIVRRPNYLIDIARPNRWSFLVLTNYPLQQFFAVLVTHHAIYIAMHGNIFDNYVGTLFIHRPTQWYISRVFDSPELCCPPASAVIPESRTTHTSLHSMDVMGSLSSMVDS